MTMTVKELIEWLSDFEDQEAIVDIVWYSDDHASETVNSSGVFEVAFDPELHVDYTDFRGNEFVSDNAPWKDTRRLLLGSID